MYLQKKILLKNADFKLKMMWTIGNHIWSLCNQMKTKNSKEQKKAVKQ